MPPTELFDERNSRQSPPDSIAQDNLQQQDNQAREHEVRKEFPVALILLDFDLGFLELIDLFVNLSESGGVLRAIILSASHVGYFCEHLFIDIDLLIDVGLLSESVLIRNTSDAAGADTDGIDANAERLRCFRGGDRRDLAGIVLAVGH